MGSRAKAHYFSSDRKTPSQNSLLVTKKFDWVLCGGDDQGLRSAQSSSSRTAEALPRRFAASQPRIKQRRPLLKSGLLLLVEMIRLELTTYTLRTYRSTG